MGEEIEVPLEAAQEHIHHNAQHGSTPWVSQVALSSAIFAVLAAVAALFAGGESNEAVRSEIRASNQWSYYQSKGIKADVLASKLELMKSLEKPIDEKDRERGEKLTKDKEQIQEQADTLEKAAEHHMVTHERLARSVTFFQVCIAIGAVAVLTKRRRFFFVSLGFGAIGLAFFVQGFISALQH
jgi:gas vesicle protein